MKLLELKFNAQNSSCSYFGETPEISECSSVAGRSIGFQSADVVRETGIFINCSHFWGQGGGDPEPHTTLEYVI